MAAVVQNDRTKARASPAERIATLDAVRGFAVLGILLLNIVSFAMPGYAYVDPTFYGGAEGANWWAWAITFVVADGKMRGLFTMLFGASTVLIAERAVASGKSPARKHYARMASLFVLGMVHAYLIWSGDILVLYAICGALAFVAWRWGTAQLLAVAALLMAAQLAGGVASHVAARQFEAQASAADASPKVLAQWGNYRAALLELRAAIPAELAAFRGGWREALPTRFTLTWEAQRRVLPGTIPETLALMLVGMALYRSGFFTGRWPPRRYRTVLLLGYGISLPFYLLLTWWISASEFDPIALLLSEPLHLVLLRPVLALAHATLIIQVVRGGWFPWLSNRLSAAGQIALSNYLGASLLCTFLFCGYGLGWFGHLQRWQLYPVVLLIWAIMLIWSRIWLERFAQGPAEWLWRSLARGHLATWRRHHAAS